MNDVDEYLETPVTKLFKYNRSFVSQRRIGAGERRVEPGAPGCPSVVQTADTRGTATERGEMQALFHRLFHKHL